MRINVIVLIVSLVLATALVIASALNPNLLKGFVERMYVLVVVFNNYHQRPPVLPPKSLPPPGTPEPRTGPFDITGPQIVKDRMGVEADLITVISRDLYWKKGTHDQFEYNGANSNLVEHLRSVGIQDILKRQDILIAVGASSFELTSVEEPIRFEEHRAQTRADVLQKIIKENTTDIGRLYTLSIGRNNREVHNSSNQRIVVIVGIKNRDRVKIFDKNSIDRDFVRSISALPFAIENYSQFILSAVN